LRVPFGKTPRWLSFGLVILVACGQLPAREATVAYAPGLRVSAYLPPGAGPFPAVVLLHGGSFVNGSRTDLTSLAETLRGDGFATFTVDYTLPAHYPRAAQQVGRAVTYIRRHFSIGRVALFGLSAGGTIAAEVRNVRAVVTWSGILDFSRAGFLTAAAREYSPLGDGSPIQLVGPGYPLVFVVNSQRDLFPLASARAFVARVLVEGGDAELFVPPTGHALRYEAAALPPTLDFLRRTLRTP
jgi:acetyl esterase/lipase